MTSVPVLKHHTRDLQWSVNRAVHPSVGSRDTGTGSEEAVITRKLVGVSRSDAGVGPTGVGGSLEARIPCRREGESGVNKTAALYLLLSFYS